MEGIVQPIVTDRTPRIGPLGIMAATGTDLPALMAALALEKGRSRSLYMSQLHIRDDGVFLSGPFMGAPYAVMLLETLVAWGAREILFLGWCGSISPDVRIGDILVPTLAWIDEGTSRAYTPQAGPTARPAEDLTRSITAWLEKEGISFHQGAIWTTDAIFRETPDKVKHYQDQGALAVEMELSAMFTVSAFLGVSFSAVLVVSDDLSGLSWNPGFKDRRFAENRRNLARALAGFLNTPQQFDGPAE